MQISRKRDVAKKELYELSTLLYQNPWKDKPPSFLMLSGGQGFHPRGTPKANMLPPGNPIWSHHNPPPHGMLPIPWMGGFENQPSGFVPGGINSVPPVRDDEASAEFFMKILCSAEKIGGVIGKGGFNVKQLQQESGSNIHVQDASGERDERVIRASAFEVCISQRLIIIYIEIDYLGLILTYYYSFYGTILVHLDYLLHDCLWVPMDSNAAHALVVDYCNDILSGSFKSKITNN